MDNDYELLYLAKEDTEIVSEVLYEKYKKIIYSKVIKYSSSNMNLEDYLNEAKLTLYEAVENYKDETKFITYLNKCLDNNLLNYKKALNRNKHKILNEAKSFDNENLKLELQVNDERYDPEEVLLEEERYNELREKIINLLSWKEELILSLKEQNYTNREISEITDNSLGTVYNIVSRIQNKVAKLMSN